MTRSESDTFENQLQNLQQNIPFEISKSNNFFKLLKDCQTIGIDLIKVHKVIHEMAAAQTNHMLKVVRGIPPLHMKIWDTLTIDKLLQPMIEMYKRLEQGTT